MTPSDTDARNRRAAARERRRTSGEEADGNGTNPATLAGDALRAAASAAAVGAAVGAARALSARRRHEPDDEQEPEPAEQPQPEAEQQEPEPQPEPEPQSKHDERDAEPEHDEPEHDEPEHDEPEHDEPEPVSPDDLQAIVRRARALLGELHGADAESVSSVARTRDGWAIGLEVLELRRIPDSTDILATYVVELDGDGRLVRFERKRRYHRAEANAE